MSKINGGGMFPFFTVIMMLRTVKYMDLVFNMCEKFVKLSLNSYLV